MSDVKCPSCGHEQEINHDDGYGYEEIEEHEQECVKCDQPFKFTTAISYDYQVFCSGRHEMKQITDGHWICLHCDHYRIRN